MRENAGCEGRGEKGSGDDSREQQDRMHFSRIESSRAGKICIAYHNIV